MIVNDIGANYPCWASSLFEAFRTGDMELIKMMKIDPKIDNVNKIFSRMKFDYWIRPPVDGISKIVDYLLTLGACINDKPNGGCSLLETCLQKKISVFERNTGCMYPYEIDHLVAKGAKLVPDNSSSFNAIRAGLYNECSFTLKGILKSLRKTSDTTVIKKIISTPKMKDILSRDFNYKRLMSELKLK